MSFATSAGAVADYETARELIAEKKWAEALPLLKKLYEEESDSVTLAKDYAQVLLRLNRREEALDLLKQHRLAKPAQIAAHSFLSKESFRFYQQGLDWFAKRAFPQACERFEKALEKDQGHADILLRLAQCEVFDANGDVAAKLLEQLERIHGKTTETAVWRAKSLLLRGRNEEASAVFTEIANDLRALAEPLAEWAILWWGESLNAIGQKSGAATLYESDYRRSPGHLQVGLASLRARVATAESPNQFSQLALDIDALEKRWLTQKNDPPKKKQEFTIPAMDADAFQRGVAELRELIRPQLPPKPSPKG